MASERKYEAHGDAVFEGKSCVALCDTDVASKAENEARARLFAAAPDLLAACQEFCRKVDAGEARSTKSYQQMSAAIEKAVSA